MSSGGTGGGAGQRWRQELAAWAIPPSILDAVTESPWRLSNAVFARRADAVIAEPGGFSWEVARAALAPSGSVLDVGAGAGAASLPLADLTTHLVAVDQSPSMMDDLARRAAELGLATRTVVGRWPDIAADDRIGVADVVVCHHVAYNVADLGAFAVALTRHARRRVVLELTPAHPLRVLNPLWLELHGLRRPDGPTADDAVAVLREVGIAAAQRRWPRPARPAYGSLPELVATTRRRLCLPPDRDAELTAALLRHGVDPDRPRDLGPPDGAPDDLVTLWWAGTG